MYRFARPGNVAFEIYDFSTYREAREWINQEVESFKKRNRIHDETDRALKNFKDELENALDSRSARYGTNCMEETWPIENKPTLTPYSESVKHQGSDFS